MKIVQDTPLVIFKKKIHTLPQESKNLKRPDEIF